MPLKVNTLVFSEKRSESLSDHGAHYIACLKYPERYPGGHLRLMAEYDAAERRNTLTRPCRSRIKSCSKEGKFMSSSHFKLWNMWLLKTTLVSLTVLSLQPLIHREWILGLFVFLVALLGVWVIGQALHPKALFKKLAEGKTFTDGSESRGLVKAAQRFSMPLLIVTIVMCLAFKIAFWMSVVICVLALMPFRWAKCYTSSCTQGTC